MTDVTPPSEAADDCDAATLLGPARLAYLTPVRAYPPLGDLKAAVLPRANGLMVSVLLLFSGPIGQDVEGPRRREAWLPVLVLAPLAVLLLLGAWFAFRAPRGRSRRCRRPWPILRTWRPGAARSLAAGSWRWITAGRCAPCSTTTTTSPS